MRCRRIQLAGSVAKPAPIPQDYTTFLAHLKQRVVAARVHAARAVNYDLVLLYWDIGQGIVEKQKNADWGDAVVERLAKDLQRAFPEMSGLSVANVWRMRQFYEIYSSTEFLAQAARELNGISPKTVAFQKLSQAVTVSDTMIRLRSVGHTFATARWRCAGRADARATDMRHRDSLQPATSRGSIPIRCSARFRCGGSVRGTSTWGDGVLLRHLLCCAISSASTSAPRGSTCRRRAGRRLWRTSSSRVPNMRRSAHRHRVLA